MLDLKSLARFCCDFLNLQRLAESVFSRFDGQLRHKQDNCFTQRSEIAGSVISADVTASEVPKRRSAKPETPTSPVFHLFFTGQSARGYKLVTEVESIVFLTGAPFFAAFTGVAFFAATFSPPLSSPRLAPTAILWVGLQPALVWRDIQWRANCTIPPQGETQLWPHQRSS